MGVKQDKIGSISEFQEKMTERYAFEMARINDAEERKEPRGADLGEESGQISEAKVSSAQIAGGSQT